MRVADRALQAVLSHARDAYPSECCGMLVGSGTVVTEAVRAGNLAPETTRFLIDPRDHLDARRAARTAGLEVLGFYHSHPHGPAWPSPTDIAEAAYPDALHLVVGMDTPALSVGVFKIDRGRVTALPLTT